MNSLLLNKKNKSISIALSCLLLFTAMILPVNAQNRRQNNASVGTQLAKNKSNAKMHAASLQVIYDQILKEYVTENIRLSGKMLSDIKKTVTKLKVYQAYFEKSDRIKLKTVLIYLDYYSGKSKSTVMRNVAKLLKEAPDKNNVTSTAIIMYLCFGEYEEAIAILKRLDAGKQIMLSSQPAVQKHRIVDPNTASKKRLTTNNTNRYLENNETLVYSQMNASQNSPSAFKGLNLLTGAMEYKLLGQKISTFNFTTIHGGTYQFDAGQGQILCMFLWSLKDHEIEGEKMYLSPDTPKTLVTLPTLNLKKNLSQFNHLFVRYRQYRKIAFLTGNLDTHNAENWLAIGKFQAKTPWPWAAVAIEHPDNRKQWPVHRQFRQLLVMVDHGGTVFYCGPVGGYLPLMLLDIQMENATPLLGLGGMPSGDVTISKSSPGVVNAQVRELPAKPTLSKNKVKVSIPKKKTVKPKDENELLADSVQAQNLLNSAIMLKKTNSYNRALSMCDIIIKDFGNTTQCQTAKELVIDILRKKPRLRKYREDRNLYVGSTLGN